MKPSTTVEHSRKQAAVSFLRLAASGRVREAFDRYASPNFRHHNPYYPGDADSLAAGMEENPAKALEVQHALEDEGMVAVHSRVQLAPDQPEVAVVHVFRFENDRIVELWDIAQPAPKDSPNENGMF